MCKQIIKKTIHHRIYEEAQTIQEDNMTQFIDNLYEELPQHANTLPLQTEIEEEIYEPTITFQTFRFPNQWRQEESINRRLNLEGTINYAHHTFMAIDMSLGHQTIITRDEFIYIWIYLMYFKSRVLWDYLITDEDYTPDPLPEIMIPLNLYQLLLRLHSQNRANERPINIRPEWPYSIYEHNRADHNDILTRWQLFAQNASEFFDFVETPDIEHYSEDAIGETQRFEENGLTWISSARPISGITVDLILFNDNLFNDAELLEGFQQITFPTARRLEDMYAHIDLYRSH